MSADGVMEDIIVDGAADPNRKRPRIDGEESEEEIEGGGKMDEDGKSLEGADGEMGTPNSKAPAHLEQGMRNLLSPGAQAIHDKREALRAELARIDEEERQRKLSKQPALVAAAGGAQEGGPSGVNQGVRGRAAKARVFGPHVPLLSTTCPPAFSVAALQATNRALKSAVHSARGAPRKIGSVVPDLLSRVRDVATAATVHSFSRTLGLRTDYARGLQCKKIFSMAVQGGLQKAEVASFVEAGLPNSVLVAEIGAAGKSGSSLAYPEMSIFLEGRGDAPVQVSTSPMAGPDGLESVYALLEGPDLVRLSESEGSLAEKILANLEQAEREGGGHKAAEAGPGAPSTMAKAIHGRLEGMNAVWVRHAANVEDAEEALNQMRADERLAKMAVPISIGNSDGKLMEGRIVSTLRFGTVKEAEGARDALVAAGYNACLRQCLSLDGKNQWVRRVSSFPKRIIEAAGGSVHLAALLQEQGREEYDSALTVTAKGGSNGERSSFVFKFSSLAGVEKARGTRTVYVNQLENSSFEIKAQPFITRVGQVVIRTGGAGQPSAVDLDIQAIKDALNVVVGKGGSTEVWELEDGAFCFRVLPLSMGLAIASKGTLRVNGLVFPIELCFAANSAVSYPKEEQPTANALLKQWLAKD